ncbi:hypothetical protein FQR65_LT06497 [Abscondita terminalis]|nr:hypothetical protein FQR65_LT06497 [Abscondita terminalis]
MKLRNTCIIFFLSLLKVQFDIKKVNEQIINKTINNNNIKIILYWTKFWNRNYPIGLGSNPFRGCKYKNCYTTFNRSFVHTEDFDAVLFHGSIYNPKIHGRPEIRNVNQRYIYFNLEAPSNKIYYNPNFTLFNNFYNLTITYRFDSDVRIRYGSIRKRKTNRHFPTAKDVEKKTKLVAWFVSHCKTTSKREDLVKAMQKYVPVDVYGKCGNLSCARSGYLSMDHCYNLLERDYKFYLSFENSLCKDYFTEKLYYVLPKTIIPIVYAGHDETILAPPNSFINIKDFENVKSLVEYMLFLDSNTTEYLKYFQWRQDYVIWTNPTRCELCEKLNEPLTPKIYENFYDWNWGNTSHPLCLVGDNLPPIVRYSQEINNDKS